MQLFVPLIFNNIGVIGPKRNSYCTYWRTRKISLLNLEQKKKLIKVPVSPPPPPPKKVHEGAT